MICGKADQILQARIGDLLKRPVGRPAHYVQRFYKSFHYKAASWSHPRRVVAKVEWHPGEQFPRVGFIITNLRNASKNVVRFYNKRGTAEQWIKEGKGAIKWTRLSCRSFNANAVRLQLHALAYNLGNFVRTLAMPEAAIWGIPQRKCERIAPDQARAVEQEVGQQRQRLRSPVERIRLAAGVNRGCPNRWTQLSRSGGRCQEPSRGGESQGRSLGRWLALKRAARACGAAATGRW